MLNSAIKPSMNSTGNMGEKKARTQGLGRGAGSGAVCSKKPITSGNKNKKDSDITYRDCVSQLGNQSGLHLA